jgi:hypothetical protein
MSSSGGDTYNPGTGGLITLFSNSRTIDPLPDIDAPSSLQVEHDPAAMQVLIAFFALAAVLPFAEMWITRKNKPKAQLQPQPQAAPKQAAPPRISTPEPSAQSIVRKVNGNRK